MMSVIGGLMIFGIITVSTVFGIFLIIISRILLKNNKVSRWIVLIAGIIFLIPLFLFITIMLLATIISVFT